MQPVLTRWVKVAHRPELVIVERITAPKATVVLQHASCVHGDVVHVTHKPDVGDRVDTADAAVLVQCQRRRHNSCHHVCRQICRLLDTGCDIHRLGSLQIPMLKIWFAKYKLEHLLCSMLEWQSGVDALISAGAALRRLRGGARGGARSSHHQPGTHTHHRTEHRTQWGLGCSMPSDTPSRAAPRSATAPAHPTYTS